MTKQNSTGPYEVRFYLTRAFADAVRLDKNMPEPLKTVLDKYGASLENQLDEFQEHAMAWQAIENWEEAFPDPEQRANEMKFERFTLGTLFNDRKREYLSREFTLVIGDQKFFSGNEVDDLVAELESLGDTVIGTGPRSQEPKTRRVYQSNGGPHAYATGMIPEKKM